MQELDSDGLSESCRKDWISEPNRQRDHLRARKRIVVRFDLKQEVLGQGVCWSNDSCPRLVSCVFLDSAVHRVSSSIACEVRVHHERSHRRQVRRKNDLVRKGCSECLCINGCGQTMMVNEDGNWHRGTGHVLLR